MAIVGGTSLVGAYFHWRSGNFVPKAVPLLGATGILGAYLGAFGTHLVSSSLLMLLFAALMLLVGGLMLAGNPPVSAANTQCHPTRCIPIGFIVGLVTGFMGVGGGFLIVPALVWFAGLDAKKSVGTSLGIIGVNSADWPHRAAALHPMGLAADEQVRRLLPDWYGLRYSYREMDSGAGAAQGVRRFGARSGGCDWMASALLPLRLLGQELRSMNRRTSPPKRKISLLISS